MRVRRPRGTEIFCIAGMGRIGVINVGSQFVKTRSRLPCQDHQPHTYPLANWAAKIITVHGSRETCHLFQGHVDRVEVRGNGIVE